MRARGVWVLVAALGLGAAGSGLAADEESKATEPAPKKAEKAKAASEAPVVYTNADLLRRFGPPEAGKPAQEEKKEGTAPAAGTPGDPLRTIEEQQARAEDKKLRVAEAEKAVADAEARVKAIQEKEAAISNPYLPPPPLTPEEQEDWKKLGSGEILKRYQAQEKEAQAELARAKARLARLTSGS